MVLKKSYVSKLRIGVMLLKKVKETKLKLTFYALFHYVTKRMIKLHITQFRYENNELFVFLELNEDVYSFRQLSLHWKKQSVAKICYFNL